MQPVSGSPFGDPAKLKEIPDMLTASITGHVGSVKLVTKGKNTVLNINLASNRRVGEHEYTDWIAAKVWGERAVKLAPHVGKGTRLLMTGRPEARAYKKPDGTPGADLVLHVNDLEFLGAKPKDTQAEA